MRKVEADVREWADHCVDHVCYHTETEINGVEVLQTWAIIGEDRQLLAEVHYTQPKRRFVVFDAPLDIGGSPWATKTK